MRHYTLVQTHGGRSDGATRGSSHGGLGPIPLPCAVKVIARQLTTAEGRQYYLDG